MRLIMRVDLYGVLTRFQSPSIKLHTKQLASIVKPTIIIDHKWLSGKVSIFSGGHLKSDTSYFHCGVFWTVP